MLLDAAHLLRTVWRKAPHWARSLLLPVLKTSSCSLEATRRQEERTSCSQRSLPENKWQKYSQTMQVGLMEEFKQNFG